MPTRTILRLTALLALPLLLLTTVTAALSQQTSQITSQVFGGTTLAGPVQDPMIQTWVDPDGHAGIEQVARLAPSHFRPMAMGSTLETRPHNAYWLRLDWHTGDAMPRAWSLTFPWPYLDLITLFVLDDQGNWRSSSAGDTVAVDSWSRPGHFPQFDMALNGENRQTVFLRIQNFKSIALQFSLEPSSERENHLKQEYLWIGILVGALLILTLWSAIQYFSFRDRIDGWYTAYTAYMTLFIVNSSGMAAEFLWPDSPWWADHSYSLLSVIAVGLTILCVRHLAGLSVRYPRFDKFLLIYSVCALASSVLHWIAAREVVDMVTQGVFLTAPLIGIFAMFLAWRRGNPIAPWLLATYLPQGFAMMIVLLQENGQLAIAHNLMFLLLTAVAVSTPLFLHCQDLITRDLKQIADRISHVKTQDALTGLLNEAALQSRMRNAVYRSFHNKEHSAVALVEIGNFDHLLQAYPRSFADQYLLRGVIKIHRIMKDVDTAGRVGTATFGLIFEGVYARQPLMERLITLIASGLVPVPGTEPEVTFRFRIAVAMLSETLYEPVLMMEKLNALLRTINPRSNRPIRFLGRNTPLPAPRDADWNSDSGKH